MTVSQIVAQDSPGPLSRAHGALSGSDQCDSCHVGGTSIDDRCIDCHREIARQLDGATGLHGRERLQECRSCHPEHAGVAFELIEWGAGGSASFDHTRTRWPLEGRHAKVECRECHRPRNQQSDLLRGVERRNVGRSWLGLDRRCAGCHADPHGGSLGEGCADCHGSDTWKPALRFKHERTDYPLQGKHTGVECVACHLVPGRVESIDEQGRRVPLYKPVAHAQCSDCHQDPHAGRLGPGCATCHVVEGFDRVDRQGFDHARTDYPLTGRHARVECAACHDPEKAWGKKPVHDSCGACHADAHAGRATIAGRPADCAACHDVAGFRPSTYSVAQHETTGYPLEGLHRETACASCHVKYGAGEPVAADLGPARVLMRPAHDGCTDCHADAHAGQLVDSAAGVACEGCHDVRGWKPSSFDAARHATLALPLAGRHAAVECAACHAQDRQGLPPFPAARKLGQARVALTGIDPACESCHHDPHAGRYRSGLENVAALRCLDCHGATAFRPAAVDPALHARFDYALEGAHRALPCSECHEELRRPPTVVRLLTVEGPARQLIFDVAHERCESCHRTPHGEQFDGKTDGCESCHVVQNFRPATRFDHDRDSVFPLQGAHRDVACARCHPSATDDTGRRRTIYRPLPQTCRDCHATDVGGLDRRTTAEE